MLTGGPARQGLESVDGAGAEIDDRLEERAQAALLDRLAQIGLQRHPVDDPLMHAVIEDRAAAAPVALGVVHGDVGVAQQLVGSDDPVEVVGDADAGATILARAARTRPARRSPRTGACRSPAPVRLRRRRRGATVNSSPPRRARRVARAQHAARMRRATSTSRRSPAVWLRLSLTSLKRSRSMNSTAQPSRGSRSPRRSALGEAIHEQRAVGQAGEAVVQRVVKQLAPRRCAAR